MNDELSAVIILEDLLNKAIERKVSDIHFEPQISGNRVRLRIDGILYDDCDLDNETGIQVISRVKVLANLDVAEKRIPQDGKLFFKYLDSSIDLRVSTFPSINGEKLVIRILDSQSNNLVLESLGFDQHILLELKKISQASNGFFLVTGPTGSGKTTTLYSILNLINDSHKNISTLEDPIEYNIEGVTQSQVYPDVGFSFEVGIRALLRQDPDVIMVGEIRDTQTARVAIQAALTGHLVFSTLHTNDASGAIIRLIDMGVESYLISSALTAVLAQRLVRTLCNDCKFIRELKLEELAFLNNHSITMDSVYDSQGCLNCFNLGYKGRTGIFQLLKVSNELKYLISMNASLGKIYSQAISDGMKSLLDDAVNKIEKGITSFQEICRVLAV